MGDVRPFRIDVGDDVLDDLRSRLTRVRLPVEPSGAGSWRRGTDTGYLGELITYWAEGYDWRAQERAMNARPQFVMGSAGGPVHFMHERSRHGAATPLVLTHGWPWTFWDYDKLVDRLTDPTRYGGSPRDAFHVVVPSLPGFAFSTPLSSTPPTWWETADLWVELMETLGYDRFGAAGGDWGAWVTAQLGHKYPDRLVGIHLLDAARLEMWATDRPWDVFEGARAGLSAEDRASFLAFERKAASHVCIQVLAPMTLAHALTDSPAGLCSWLIERRRSWSDCGGDLESVYSMDELITSVMLYWCTNSVASSMAIYPSAVERPWTPSHGGEHVVSAATALSTFRYHSRPAGEWAEHYYDLRWRRDHDRGGHFSPAEVPDAVAADLRESFATFRGGQGPEF